MMSPRRVRPRAVLLVTVLAALGVPLAMSHAADPCGRTLANQWHDLPTAPFSLAGSRTITSYDVDRTDGRVLVTNGASIDLSDQAGCRWRDSYVLPVAPQGSSTLTRSSAQITQVVLRTGKPSLAAVAEGPSGSPSARPHVLREISGRNWATIDNGLPAAGRPITLRAAVNNPSTLYLSVAPVQQPTTGLPLPGGQASPGVLYRSGDGGDSWELASSLARAGSSLQTFVVDPVNSRRLFAIANGRLVRSTDGGSTFGATQLSATGLTSLDYLQTSTGAGQLVVGRPGHLYTSSDGSTFDDVQVPSTPDAAASTVYGGLYFSTSTGIYKLSARRSTDVGPGVGAASRYRIKSTLLGYGAYFALTTTGLVRYDVPRPSNAPPPDSGNNGTGGVSVGPVRLDRASISPGSTTVNMKVGERRRVRLNLELPPQPTPIDIMYAVDSSESQSDIIRGLANGLNRVGNDLARAHIDVKAGITQYNVLRTRSDATRVDNCPTHVFERLRDIGNIDNSLRDALVNLQACRSGKEPVKLAVDQIVTGSGVPNPSVGSDSLCQLAQVAAVTCALPPNQDATWRNGTVRIVLNASDEVFDPEAQPDISLATIGAHYKARGVKFIGLSTGYDHASAKDLRALAAATGSFVGPAGLACNDDAHTHLRPGAPLVCPVDISNTDASQDLSVPIVALIKSIKDVQPLEFRLLNGREAFAGFATTSAYSVDVKKLNTRAVDLIVDCAGLTAGAYDVTVGADLGAVRLSARSTIHVICGGIPGLPPPRINPPPANNPPGSQGQPPPNPPQVVNVAPPPVVTNVNPNVQTQPQAQAQVQIQGGLSQQEQERIQLATALNNAALDRDEENQFAMSERQHRPGEFTPALTLLTGVVMTGCAGAYAVRTRKRGQLAPQRDSD
jgi:hypothetical protein